MSCIPPETIEAAERMHAWRLSGDADGHPYWNNDDLRRDDESALIGVALARLAADKAEREAAKERPLSCDIVDGQLVIRIGLATLKHAAEHCPVLYDEDRRPYPPYCTVADAEQLARDVRGELLREEEDGETPLHRLLDEAIVATWEQGSIAFADEEGGDA